MCGLLVRSVVKVIHVVEKSENDRGEKYPPLPFSWPLPPPSQLRLCYTLVPAHIMKNGSAIWPETDNDGCVTQIPLTFAHYGAYVLVLAQSTRKQVRTIVPNNCGLKLVRVSVTRPSACASYPLSTHLRGLYWTSAGKSKRGLNPRWTLIPP